MGDAQPAPRYGLRPPSPKKMKAPAPPPPLPPRIPISPKRFTSPLGRTQSALLIAKDVSVEASSSAHRKLSFCSATAKKTEFTKSSTNILGGIGGGSSSSNISDRSLRASATFFSLSTSSFIPRVRSTACLPVAPIEGANRRAASAPTPVPLPPSRQSKSRLEQIEESSFSRPSAPPLPPPRRAYSTPTPSGGEQKIGLSRGGLSRSLATARLQPAAKVLLQEEEEKKERQQLQPASSSGASAAGAATAAEKSEEERSAPLPLVQPRRVLATSASVTYLRQDAPESSSSRHSTAVRVRPPSPVRIAKNNSGLLRSYSSVVCGANRESEGPINRVAPPASPLKVLTQQKKPESSTVTSASTVAKLENRFVSTAVISLTHREDRNEARTPRESIVRPTPSGLRKCPTFSTLTRSAASTSDLHPIDNKKPRPLCDKKDTVVVQESAVEKKDCGPPPSPITRSLKRRLLSGADSDHQEEEGEGNSRKTPSMKIQFPAPLATSTPIAQMPSASFFLRDDVAVVTPEGEMAKMGDGTLPDETTPKPARRSKKMRRLEMESGEVDDEARLLAFDSSTRSSGGKSSPPASRPPATYLSSCKVMQPARVEYTTPTTRSKREERREDDDMGEGSSCAAATVAAAAVTPLRPPPDRSALRRADKEERSGRSIRFEHVQVLLFERTQGVHTVPSQGEICLGMATTHHGEERHWLDGRMETEDVVMDEDGRGEEEEELSDGEIRPPPFHSHQRMAPHSSPRRLPPGEKYTTKHIEPLNPKTRSRVLRTSGVKIARESSISCLSAIPEHESIRQRRRQCGCSCEGGICRPETCECALEGIPCQVDTEEGFPCYCRIAENCQNDQGRVEFNPQKVYEHYQRTFARLKLAEKMGTDSLASPTLIRFTDDDEPPRHNATSYLATPPPAIYQSPTVATKQPKSPTEAKVLSTATLAPSQPCTPPMPLQKEGGGGETSVADGAVLPPHARFPVTPVYKKYSVGGGEKPIREVPLARMAIFKSATTATVPSTTVSSIPDEPSEPDAYPVEDLDDSMDTSIYATPPESRSPAIGPQEPTVSSEQLATSPRKFATFQSLI